MPPAWEIAIKIGLKKLALQIPFEQLFPNVLKANGFLTLLPTFDHYRVMLELPYHHRDPFDHLLLAQAKAENLTLVECDKEMTRYGLPLLW